MPERAGDVLVHHRVGLERYGSHVVKRIQKIIEGAQDDVEMQVRRKLPWAGKNPKRLRQLHSTLKDIQREAHKMLRRELKDDLSELAEHETEFAEKFYRDGVGIGINLTHPSAALLRSAAFSNPFLGEVLYSWAKKMERGQIERIRRQIVMGVVQGESIDEIVARLRGTGALQFRDGQFAKDLRSAEALVRTAVNHVSNRAHLEVARANPELFPWARHISVLDSRTTPICRARAGKVFPIEEFVPPPLHWNCRSTFYLISSFEKEPKTELRYDAWLRRQPREVVEDILGQAKARLFLDGKLKIDRFVNRKGDELTLSELKAREKEAWERAFGKGTVVFADGRIARPKRKRRR